ncbi:transporter substrate-binding domain-containing protein [Flexivirga endophytica]|uniref:transporter substrate-binding domain-containing protein n=1 Tax=Flexivirga endophytica TaxID=1849103 RepID=UPI00166504E6|nr:transporter substrate-binding domain-containing protein [Flexivirga endophytica]
MLRRSLLAGAALAIALTSCSSGSGHSPGASSDGNHSAGRAADAQPAVRTSRLDRVKSTKKLRVCTTGDYRPFTYVDPKTKKRSGIDVDMAESLAKSLGARISWVPTSWKDLMPDFLAGCDIAMGGVSISTDRAQQASFTDPVLTEGKTPITLCSKVSKYDTVAEINKTGVRAITPEGGTNEAFARANYPKAKIVVWGDNNTIFDQIVKGKVDVMTTDASETVWVAKTHPKLCAVHPMKPFNYSQKAYLLPRGDDDWQEYVNTWLNIAKHDGTWTAATKPWFGDTTLR